MTIRLMARLAVCVRVPRLGRQCPSACAGAHGSMTVRRGAYREKGRLVTPRGKKFVGYIDRVVWVLVRARATMRARRQAYAPPSVEGGWTLGAGTPKSASSGLASLFGRRASVRRGPATQPVFSWRNVRRVSGGGFVAITDGQLQLLLSDVEFACEVWAAIHLAGEVGEQPGSGGNSLLCGVFVD